MKIYYTETNLNTEANKRKFSRQNNFLYSTAIVDTLYDTYASSNTLLQW